MTNPDIFVLGTDLIHRGGHWAQVKGLAELMGPGRISTPPISEGAMVATGVGATLAGLHPIVDLNFVDFAFGAMDEIVNQGAKVEFMLFPPHAPRHPGHGRCGARRSTAQQQPRSVVHAYARAGGGRSGNPYDEGADKDVPGARIR